MAPWTRTTSHEDGAWRKYGNGKKTGNGKSWTSWTKCGHCSGWSTNTQWKDGSWDCPLCGAYRPKESEGSAVPGKPTIGAFLEQAKALHEAYPDHTEIALCLANAKAAAKPPPPKDPSKALTAAEGALRDMQAKHLNSTTAVSKAQDVLKKALEKEKEAKDALGKAGLVRDKARRALGAEIAGGSAGSSTDDEPQADMSIFSDEAMETYGDDKDAVMELKERWNGAMAKWNTINAQYKDFKQEVLDAVVAATVKVEQVSKKRRGPGGDAQATAVAQPTAVPEVQPQVLSEAAKKAQEAQGKEEKEIGEKLAQVNYEAVEKKNAESKAAEEKASAALPASATRPRG